VRQRRSRPVRGGARGTGAGAGAGRRLAADARPWAALLPVVSRIAAEHGIDLGAVAGTGRGGRVRKQDVLALVDGHGGGNGAGTGAGAGAGAGAPEDPPLHIESPYRPDPAAATPTAAAGGGAEGLSRMRRQVGEHMKRSLDTAATCTTWIEADMGRVEAARAKLGVTALAFVARATVDALREHPALNAWLDGDTYTRVDDVNLGIAVSLGTMASSCRSSTGPRSCRWRGWRRGSVRSQSGPGAAAHRR